MRRSRGSAAFSLVELLVALVIAAGVLATAVIVFGSLVTGPRGSVYPVVVHLGSDTLAALYGMESATIEVPSAPNYGTRVQADLLRDEFWSDVRHATAVFCLGRSGRNTFHPLTISMPAWIDGRSIDSPNAFRELLGVGASVFTPFVDNVSSATNGSIFILQPSQDADELSVRAIYDIDIVPTASGTEPAGTYVSVQRYALDGEGGMSRASDFGDGYFHVFYPGAQSAFSPMFVFFERAAEKSVTGDSADRFKVAEGRPFYFVWWPDPTMPSLATTSTRIYLSSDPRSAYAAMGGRTSYFFAVPMMPAL